MHIDHVHFYIKDAPRSRDWFVKAMNFQDRGWWRSRHTQTGWVSSGPVNLLLSSPLTPESPWFDFARSHPPGVMDLAFRVDDLEGAIDRAIAAGAQVLEPARQSRDDRGGLKWARVAGWGSLSHTLVERRGRTEGRFPQLGELNVDRDRVASAFAKPVQRSQENRVEDGDGEDPLNLLGIDHVVLNVKSGELEAACDYYQKSFGFERQQSFTIRTGRSGLYSQVLVHPGGQIELPINEPTSDNSQIQEFLECNGGSGIQHIALRTDRLVETIARWRRRGVSFIDVPATYYAGLARRCPVELSEETWGAIAAQGILVDWQDEASDALLLQTFTQPIFDRPTFFFEAIERYRGALGFGEGNFQALFEAIERAQIERSRPG
ncbi:4-hydroxyphenylpyruvate dioxygenase [Oxynema aestuarii]|uniref:4-hydroxyphenylpyruvate dioxygenase n=1 Tax=Oxynema aestuarii AP17 TaxID=2064643 RepID=A0A6H1TVU7_9CYAN|nr:4-hydroxyphenylpyruvate dioxygenase [Oxynema aestuarii]QIZ70728.1 4-hydroxyphenylpyruvate dioxygenase [Oxynema aestuarii AP17]